VNLKTSKNLDYSFEKEKEIAKRFSTRFQWEMIIIGIGQACVWLALWPLTSLNIIPLWIAFIIATICACLAYLPSHESQHGNYSRGKSNLKWLDAFVGHITLIPLIYPYEILRVTHMKHHAYSNDPNKDPDYRIGNAKSQLDVLLMSLDGTTTDYGDYLEVFKDDPAFQKAFNKGLKIYLTYRFILMTLVILFPLKTLFLWWLPAKIGTAYTSLFFSWYPHQGTEIGRYKNTRFWQHWIPRYLNHSMQLHFIHHLHPSIGHYDEPKAVEALKQFLITKGVPGAEDIPEKISFNPLIKL